MIGSDELRRRFARYAQNDEKASDYVAIRNKARDLAEHVDAHLVDSREKSLAVTALEEAVFWACKGLDREGDSE